ncbi:MAG: hypothetical protein J7K82_06890 [Thermoproteales archaeon]|nr:hypothetical protein [Thermoproteales archaeon]
MPACRAGVLRSVIDPSEEKLFVDEVKKLAKNLKNSMIDIDKRAAEKVALFKNWDRCYLTSRGINFPIALEGV